MTRLNLLLLIAVLGSAIALVRAQYESRRLFVELDKSIAEAHRIEVEADQLEVQKRAQATSSRVERLAKERLNMRAATAAITQYVTYERGADDAGAAGARP